MLQKPGSMAPLALERVTLELPTQTVIQSMLTRLFKGDRDKILAERRNKGVKLGNGGKVGSYTSGNNKSLKTLQNQNKKFKRQILALNRTGGGKDDDSGDEDNENYPSDAGDAFGGRNRKKANKKI